VGTRWVVWGPFPYPLAVTDPFQVCTTFDWVGGVEKPTHGYPWVGWRRQLPTHGYPFRSLVARIDPGTSPGVILLNVTANLTAVLLARTGIIGKHPRTLASPDLRSG
jgi:hypothetical protein